MGYWGYMVAASSDKPLDEVPELQAFGHDYVKVDPIYSDWQLAWVAGGNESPLPGVQALAGATGGPAIGAFVLDSDCGFVAAATPSGESWTGTLARSTAISSYDMPDDKLSVDTATDTLARWAAAAGLNPNPATLRQALDPDAIGAESLFTLLLDGIGLTPQH